MILTSHMPVQIYDKFPKWNMFQGVLPVNEPNGDGYTAPMNRPTFSLIADAFIPVTDVHRPSELRG
jgi:hypothetical protein